MGSPETKKKRRTPHPSAVAEPPSIAERIKLLKLGIQTKLLASPENFNTVLEGMKGVLLPMVRWLDKPVSELSGFFKLRMPEHVQKKRAMLVYDGYGRGVFSIALDRSGRWFVELFDTEDSKAFRTIDSAGLAAVIIDRIDALLSGMMIPIFGEWNRAKKELGFLENLLRYAAFVEFVSKCHKTVQETIEDHEKRTRVMRARTDLLGDYAQALDPIRAHGEKALLPGYAILHRHSRGETRSTAAYLIPEALKPFWDILKFRVVSPEEQYREFDDSRALESLKELVTCFSYLLENIREGCKYGGDPPDAKKILGSSGRLPFTKEEVVQLRNLVDQIGCIRI